MSVIKHAPVCAVIFFVSVFNNSVCFKLHPPRADFIGQGGQITVKIQPKHKPSVLHFAHDLKQIRDLMVMVMVMVVVAVVVVVISKW